MDWNELNRYEKDDIAWGIGNDLAKHLVDYLGGKDNAYDLVVRILVDALHFDGDKAVIKDNAPPALIRVWMELNRNNDDYHGYFDR